MSQDQGDIAPNWRGGELSRCSAVKCKVFSGKRRRHSAGWRGLPKADIKSGMALSAVQTHDSTPSADAPAMADRALRSLATAAALTATIVIRFENAELASRLVWLPELLAGFVALAAVVYFLTGLHEAKWRFTSMPELKRIIRASAVLAISLLVLDYVLFSPHFYGTFFFGKITIALYFVIQTVFLSASRIAYRYFRDERTQRQARDVNAVPTLILGRADEVEVPLRAIESGAIRQHLAGRSAVAGALRPGRQRRGVPVLGDFDDLEQVIALCADARHDRDAAGAHALGLCAGRRRIDPDAGAAARTWRRARCRRSTEAGTAVQLAPVAVEDLLLRPSVAIDYRRLKTFLKGKSVVVTGGGGSIGADICDRVVTFGAARLLMVENSEPALLCGAWRRWRQRSRAPRSTAGSPTCATASASSGC